MRSMEDLLGERMPQIQANLLAQFPEAKFKLGKGDQEGIWHFSIYTETGRIQIPLEVTNDLNQIWRDHRVSIVTVVYPLSLYEEEEAAAEEEG